MRTETIIPQPIQEQIDAINNEMLILAEVELDEITGMPDYQQVLRVLDNVAALSQEYFKVIPKRILIHKVTGQELDLNLPVPDWTKTGNDVSALINESTGERVLVEQNTYDDVVIDEETGETEEQLISTEEVPVLVPTLKYLRNIIKRLKYHEAFGVFTVQYVNDIKAVDPDYFKRLA